MATSLPLLQSCDTNGGRVRAVGNEGKMLKWNRDLVYMAACTVLQNICEQVGEDTGG